MKGLILNGAPAITSREIAQLVGLRHDNVKRTIETLVGQGVVACPQSEEKPTAGRPVVEYVFSGAQGKRDSIIVVAQLSPAFTARLVDRWQELEANVAQPDPMVILTDPAAMRGLLLTYTEKVISLEQTVAEQAPQVATLHRIAAADGSLCMRDAAKALQVRPVDLRRWLVAHGWIYQRPGHSGWLAYQDRIQQGGMCHKVTTVQREDGSDKIVEQVRITPKGIARIGAELAKAAA